MPEGRILFIDAYDSFSNNIIGLLKNSLPVTVESIKIDDVRFVFNDDAFRTFLNGFDAVVAGPGPGHPGSAEDVGLIGTLWKLSSGGLRDGILPVLGICLGFQSLALAFGASVERLKEPRHGLVRRTTHCNSDIFAGMDRNFEATQYHSLHVILGYQGQDERRGQLFKPSAKCKELLPLAWDMSDAENGPILMGVRHCHKPFWGVQYHPESICSTAGPHLVQNWWREVCRWNASTGRYPELGTAGVPLSQPTFKARVPAPIGRDPPKPTEESAVSWKEVLFDQAIDTAHVVDALREVHVSEPLVLESGIRNGKPVNPETGRFSIIGLPDSASLRMRWSVKEKLFTVFTGSTILHSQKMSISDVLTALDAIVDEHRAYDGPAEIPFWGGLVGYISYEAGLEAIDVPPAESAPEKPDVWFVLVERSVVIDHVTGASYAKSIRRDDAGWLSQTEQLLRTLQYRPLVPVYADAMPNKGNMLSGPAKDVYCSKVSACQSHLRAGSSYELCLTDQTLIHNSSDPWLLYRKLRAANPAPFGAYLRFSDSHGSGVDIIGSSPERFLSWSRSGHCQFRPIKGTVKKTPAMTKAKAEALLSSEKERAENLMIVDLIRHDLSGVPGVQDVQVPKLMSVEEYETVFQLVSVIEGSLPSTASPTSVLANSLPPGSMTGAPKKRSCELLRELEGADRPRGLYSGVLGYMDVGGGGDFSVVIRTAFKWSGGREEEDVWRVGAGGAVTALSEPEAEWEEMLAKRQSLLDVLLADS